MLSGRISTQVAQLLSSGLYSVTPVVHGALQFIFEPTTNEWKDTFDNRENLNYFGELLSKIPKPS